MIQEQEGRRRAIIEGVRPEIDGGRFPIKRALGEKVTVEADIFADGHDSLSAVLRYRREEEADWSEMAMEPLVNDRWRASFAVTSLGNYYYSLEGWVDAFKSWRRDLEKKVRARMDIAVELLSGARLLEEAIERSTGGDAKQLRAWARELAAGTRNSEPARIQLALSPAVAEVMARYPDRRFSTAYGKVLRVVVDPELARFGAWYEIFPRSFSSREGRHGTFRDCLPQLERVRDMGFDVVYFPPIHPIGKKFRKGKNNSPASEPDDCGSPWAIGGNEGGHKAIHPELGTLEDFRLLIRRAGELNLEVALDIAYQCSPDHPYVQEHPEWFRKRPDGSIQYAENPPKKYQDIYPFDFESEDWQGLWKELKSIFDFWIGEGVHIFRVDNPHTKAFPFWEWAMGELKKEHPDLIFLSEAFTRPKVKYYLAKLGFTQSYNYFPWRNTKHEITQYLTELTRSEVREYFRPSLWPNTPDILPQFLQYGGRQAFLIRFVLAATLGATYGIYGPAFELGDNIAREPGTEEYLNSEKYEIRRWKLDSPDSLAPFISKVNQIRRENPALHGNDRLEFHPTDNEHLIAYSKITENLDNVILVIVNLDPHHTHSGWIDFSLKGLEIEPNDTYQVHDLLTGGRYFWQGRRNYVEIDPRFVPAHIFRIRRRVRTEHDFDYFM